MSEVQADFVKHVSCELCGSSDGRALYSDGHSYCFALCDDKDKYQQDHEDSEVVLDKPLKYDRIVVMNKDVEYRSIPERGISRATCEKYGVVSSEKTHEYPYFDRNGKKLAVKYREVETKKFHSSGDIKACVLFGQQLFHSGGKAVTITEGEIDALAAFQMTGSLYPVVSLKNGAAAAVKDCQAQFEWLDSFDKVVICFDADEPGKKAAVAVAELFGNKARIIKHVGGFKDAADYLTAGAEKKYVDAFWRAEEYRPEGIVTVKDIKERLLEPPKQGVPWCFDRLTQLTYGRRPGELYAFGAGVGIGKTDVFTQSIAHDVTELGLKVGVIYLEQSVKETVQRVAGKIHGKRFHKPDDESWTREQYLSAIDDLEQRDQLVLFEHFGAMDWETVKGKIRYLAKAYDIKHIYLDHLTALAAGLEDERRGLDAIMADMASLAQSDGLIIHFISHLTTPEGKSHEEGGRVLEKHFTGSRAIARWAHYMFGLERNKQEEDPVKKQTTTFRVLKDRWLGDATGEKFGLLYNKDSGRLTECELEVIEAL